MFRKKETSSVIRQFQSETEALRGEADTVRTRVTLWSLGGLLVVCIGVASIADVDRVVTSMTGEIITVDPVINYQALDPSIIKTLDVQNGQLVEAGQLIATLDPTFAVANVNQLTLQIASLDAQIARDEAELLKKPLMYPTGMSSEFAYYAGLQKSLYDQRVAQHKAQLLSFDEKISSTEATINKFKIDQGHYKDRTNIAKDIEDMRQDLLNKDAGSKLNLMQQTDQKYELLREMDYDQNSLVEAQHSLDSIRADRDAFEQQWETSLSQDLVTARNNKDTATSQLAVANKHEDLVKIVAPELSVVLQLTKLSVGSVLSQGASIATLAPLKSPVEAQVWLSSRDVGFVRPGDPVTLKVDAYEYTQHGTADGTLKWVSEGAFTTDDNGAPAQPHYLARVKVESYHFIGVPANFRLVPGMTLTADVHVGTRTLLSYVVEATMRGVGEGMRDP